MKLLLDCDTGVDDAVAIAYALASPEAEVLGIGSVHGNVEADTAAENTLKVLGLVGRTDVPVAVGAERPLLRPLDLAKLVHGEDGLGNTNLPPSGLSPSGEHAADQIVRLARELPGEVTLVCTAPLTNVAIALMKEPRLPSLVREVVLMGGTAVEPGNVGPVAEANVYHDPEAASLVFAAPWRIRMAGLDVTMRTLLREHHLERLSAADTPLTDCLVSVLAHYFEFYTGSLGHRACAMHDSVAVGLALGTVEVLESHLLPVYVCTSDGPALGQTVVDRRPLANRSFSAPGAHTEVMFRIGGEEFLNHLVRRLCELVV